MSSSASVDHTKDVPWTELNSNKTKATCVRTSDMPYQETYATGVYRKMIERLGGEVARCTTVVKYDANRKFPRHTHTGGEEFLVLEGVWRDDYGTFPKYSYIRNYIGSSHQPEIGPEGCVIMVKLRQMSIELPEKDHTSEDASPNGGGWEKNVVDGKEKKFRTLFESRFEKVTVESWAAGSELVIDIPVNGKEIFVIDGSFTSDKFGVYDKYSWTRLVHGTELGNLKANDEGDLHIYIKEGHLNSPEACSGPIGFYYIIVDSTGGCLIRVAEEDILHLGPLRIPTPKRTSELAEIHSPRRTMKENMLKVLMDEAIAYSTFHGLSMIDPQQPAKFIHAPVSLLPAPYPKAAFQKAAEVASIYNILVDKISRDQTWLLETLRSVLEGDEFTSRLVGIYEDASNQGVSQEWYLGLNRSDYMLNNVRPDQHDLLQIELNTISSSFGALSARVSRMHKFLVEKAAEIDWEQFCRHYGLDSSEISLQQFLGNLPENRADENLVEGLAAALRVFNETTNSASRTILFLVQRDEKNVFDQRALEYELYRTHEIHVLRKTLKEVGELCNQDEQFLVLDRKVIGVVYFRAGYTPNDYTSEVEWTARAKIEFSNAIKCPSIAYHLAGTKKVQQRLAAKGEVERFLSTEDALIIRNTFAGLWSMDKSEQTSEDRNIVQSAREDPSKFVMKPQREGGGNNFYGDDIKHALDNMNEKQLSSYILMQRIFPSEYHSFLLRDSKLIRGSTISELGLFGVYLGNGREIRINKAGGHLLRTKLHGVDEGGVATGYSYLDSPALLI